MLRAGNASARYSPAHSLDRSFHFRALVRMVASNLIAKCIFQVHFMLIRMFCLFQVYVLFHTYPYQDLQKYIASKKRGLKESEAANLFGQIVSLVKHCHQRGIILRSIHLRNLIFADQFR